jgi:hypothetical protein
MSLSATAPTSAGASASAPSPEHILQTGFGFWASKTLLSAAEMEVSIENLEELTGRLGMHPRSARDFLDAPVALGFLERHDALYSSTPSTDMFLGRTSGGAGFHGDWNQVNPNRSRAGRKHVEVNSSAHC